MSMASRAGDGGRSLGPRPRRRMAAPGGLCRPGRAVLAPSSDEVIAPAWSPEPAKAVCARCPVAADGREWAIRTPRLTGCGAASTKTRCAGSNAAHGERRLRPGPHEASGPGSGCHGARLLRGLGRGRRSAEPKPSPASCSAVTANRVVSYRLREAHRQRGWTQAQAAEHLAPYLGVRWSPASFSAAEGGGAGRAPLEGVLRRRGARVCAALALPLWFYCCRRPPPAPPGANSIGDEGVCRRPRTGPVGPGPTGPPARRLPPAGRALPPGPTARCRRRTLVEQARAARRARRR